MATNRKRRIRSPHPGVVILKRTLPSGAVRYQARYTDPDTGKEAKPLLDALALPTAEARTLWAKRKAVALAKRRMQIESGAPRATGSALSTVIARYYTDHPQLRPRTVTAYRGATDKLLNWADRRSLTSADDLNRARLLEWRASLVAEPKHMPVRGVKHGKRKALKTRRSALSVNRELRAARTVLGYLSDLDLFPLLTHDDLRRALKRLEVTHERLAYLRPGDVQALLRAAVRHDADCHTLTRAEHAGKREPGTTLAHEPIAPFIAVTLLTGMRFGEAIGLDWKHIDLRARDQTGREVGEIHLPGASTKTHRARTIDLAVSPALHRLLDALRKRDGGKGPVFRMRECDEHGKPVALTAGTAIRATKRLRSEYAAPGGFTWQALRRTCGTYLTNAPGIFGAASAYRSARQLGHSVTIAERHYVDLARGIPSDARTLEAAMHVGDVLEDVIRSVTVDHSTGNVARLARKG